VTIETAFGLVIRRLRKERRLSQEDLSRTSSLGRVFISQLERGKQQPTLITMFELASALNVTVSRIMSEAESLLWLNKSNLYRLDKNHAKFENLWDLIGDNLMSNVSDPARKETILVVDDELQLRKLLTDLLEFQGYAVITAEDGADAVAKYKENQADITMVLMDIIMPRKDGLSAFKEITELNPRVKILLMSGYSAVTLGKIEDINFIQKPLLPTALLKNIRQIIDSDESQAV